MCSIRSRLSVWKCDGSREEPRVRSARPAGSHEALEHAEQRGGERGGGVLHAGRRLRVAAVPRDDLPDFPPAEQQRAQADEEEDDGRRHARDRIAAVPSDEPQARAAPPHRRGRDPRGAPPARASSLTASGPRNPIAAQRTARPTIGASIARPAPRPVPPRGSEARRGRRCRTPWRSTRPRGRRRGASAATMMTPAKASAGPGATIARSPPVITRNSLTKPLSGGRPQMAAAPTRNTAPVAGIRFISSSEPVDFPGARRRGDGAGAEEQQPLEQRMVDHVQERAAVAEQRQQGRVETRAEHAQSDAEADDPDVLDAVVGEEALHVVLRKGEEHAEDARDRADQEQRPPPPRRRGPEDEEGPDDPVDPHLDHHPAHERRDVRRGGGVGLGQPDVQRDDAGLGAEPDQGEEERRCRRGRGEAAEAREVESGSGEGRIGVRSEEREEGEEEPRPDLGCHEVRDAGTAVLLVGVLEGDEVPGDEGHGLPRGEERDRVAGEQDQHHAGSQQVVKQPRRAGASRRRAMQAAAQVPSAVERRRGRHAVDGQQEQARHGIRARS